MNITTLPLSRGALAGVPVPTCPTKLSKVFWARIAGDPKRLERDFLPNRGWACPPLAVQLNHGECLEFGATHDEDGGRIRWYGVVLAEGAVTEQQAQLRVVACDHADQALRLARAILDADPRAGAYLPGGAALGEDLALPREVKPWDMASYPRLEKLPAPRVLWLSPEVPVSDPAPWKKNDVPLMPAPQRTRLGGRFVGCINVDQERAVYARGFAAGMNDDELRRFLHRKLGVPEVMQLRTYQFRTVMDELLPAAGLELGRDVLAFVPSQPMERVARALDRYGKAIAEGRSLKARA